MASSTIVQDGNGDIYVYVKGADSSIMKMSGNANTSEAEREAERFAAMGLRTLVFAYKKTSIEQLNPHNVDEHDFWESLQSSDVETDLEIVAVTAVEDLL